MSRIKLWEDTVVLAMRDFQWMYSVQDMAQDSRWDFSLTGIPINRSFPPGFKRDGRGEEKIERISLGQGEVFYIFEVKSTEEEIRAEWGAKTGPKYLFNRLNALVQYCSDSSVANCDALSYAKEMLWLSLKGHFAAYWDDTSKDGQVSRIVEEYVAVKPYVAACSSARNLIEVSEGVGMPWPKCLKKMCFSDGGKTGRESVSFDSLLSKRHELQPSSFTDNQLSGLSKSELCAYLGFLLGSESSAAKLSFPSDLDVFLKQVESIHAVVLSSRGAYFRVVSDTSHLNYLLDGKFRMGVPSKSKRNKSFGSREVLGHQKNP
ncbi:hypothetical protein [Xanthomonas axonopodis]